jgi:hypothetical protein
MIRRFVGGEYDERTELMFCMSAENLLSKVESMMLWQRVRGGLSAAPTEAGTLTAPSFNVNNRHVLAKTQHHNSSRPRNPSNHLN